MTLAPGTRLGPYEITAPLGSGGMGEVYRARDTRLGRDVAGWGRGGRELFYLGQDRRLMAVAVTGEGAALAVGEPRALFQAGVSGREAANSFSQYAVTRDGARFLVSTAVEGVLPITLVRNWPRLGSR